jgi:hypothetical protein
MPPAAVLAAPSRCPLSIVMHRIIQNRVVCSLRCAASLQPSPRPASLVERSSCRPRAPSAANHPRTRTSRCHDLQDVVFVRVLVASTRVCTQVSSRPSTLTTHVGRSASPSSHPLCPAQHFRGELLFVLDPLHGLPLYCSHPTYVDNRLSSADPRCRQFAGSSPMPRSYL